MARHATAQGRRPWRLLILAFVALAAIGAFVGLSHGSTNGPHPRLGDPRSSTTTSTSTSTTSASTATTAGLPLPAGPGFIAGQVTAVGDSVMLDYQDPLKASIPGIQVDASVSRQWTEGESILAGLKAQGQLGALVVVGLGTNGPITATDVDDMMAILHGASRVVFVNVHVDRPWQGPNNAVLAGAAARYPNVVVADWSTLAAQNPQWFGADGVHLGIDGPGAAALAKLVATTLANG